MERVVEAEAAEMREPLWEKTLERGLALIRRSADELSRDRKGEGWKVDLARFLRETHLTPYRWIAKNLHMGAPSYVQSLVSRARYKKPTREWKILQKHGKLD